MEVARYPVHIVSELPPIAKEKLGVLWEPAHDILRLEGIGTTKKPR